MSLSPQRVEELLGQAHQALAQGNVAQAHALGATLLADRPGDPQVHALMGEACLVAGLLDQAIEHRRIVAERNPGSPLRQVQLAETYVHAGRLGDALAHYAQALALDPDFPPAIAGRAEVYEMQGNFKRAWKTLEPALARWPTNPSLAAVGVRVLMEMGRLKEAIALGQRLVEADLPHEPQLRSAVLSLARAYEKDRQYDRALEAARIGNAMLAVPFDPQAYKAQVDRIIEAFDADWMAQAPRAELDGSWAVFIVGMPRSGSTLTERIIHAHPQAFGADEDFALHLLISALPETQGVQTPWPECVRELTAGQLTDCGNRYERAMRRRAPSARIISNKDLANMRRLGMADLILPGAKFIHTRRNPADNCLSCYFERLRPTAIPYAGRFDHLALAYAQNQRLADHWQRVCKNPMLTVDYEDLVNDLPGAARRIIDFVGLPWDDRCLRPHEANRPDRTLSVTQVRRPIYRSAKGRAARYGDRIAPLYEALRAQGIEPTAPAA